jgi:O-antigen/teichoic acid export membrane protein
MASLRGAAIFALTVHLASRIVGFIANVLLLRLFLPNWIGGFTLIVGTAQFLSSLARLGTDYTFQLNACKLPAEDRGGLQKQFLIWNFFFNAIAVLLAWPFLKDSLSTLAESPIAVCLIFAYLFVESYVDVLWEPVLSSRRYSTVFSRHFQVAITKGFLPLIAGLAFGWLGLILGLLLASCLNCIAAIFSLSRLPTATGMPLPLRRFLSEGLPFFAVPVAQQFVFWPAMLSLADGRGLASVGLIRVAQLMMQVVGVIPAAIAPILMIENAHGHANSIERLARSMRLMALIGTGIFAIYCLLDTTLVTVFFGKSYVAAVVPARAMVLAAVYTSVAQLFQQQAFQGKYLWQQCGLQLLFFCLCAPIGLIWLLPKYGVEGFALLTLAVAFGNLFIFLLWDPQRVTRSWDNFISGIFLLVAPLLLLQHHP